MKIPSRLLFALFFVLTSGLAGPAFAQGDNDPIKITDVRIGFMGSVKLGYWLPIAVEVDCKEALQGILEIRAPDSDGLETATYREAFAAPNQRNTLHHHIRIGGVESEILIQLRDQTGSVVARRRVDLNSDQSVKILTRESQFYVYLGSPGGLFEATNDDKKVDIENQKAVPLRIIEDLPRQWFDYASVDKFVIPTADPTVFDRMDAAQIEAIETWVRQGGELVVGVGRNHQLVSESFLAKLLPARLAGVARVRQPDALESFSRSKNRFNVGTQGLEVADLADIKGRVLVRQGDRPIIVQGSYGLGSVTLIGFDIDEAPFVNWQDRIEFWIELFGIKRISTNPEDVARMNQMSFSGVSDLATLLATHLEDFPEVTVVPFGWVALLIFGYILLIGPIDYLFLKKVVGRLELTWITFPTWVIVISVAAYFAAHWLKGDELRINRIEVVDVDQESETLRGTGFVSIFSPRIDKYSISYTPSLASTGNWQDLGVGRQQSPKQVSWMGVPENAFRGMYNQGSVGLFGKRGYAYAGPNVDGLVDVPIQVWSVKSLTGQWLGKSKKVFDTNLVGRDVALSGTLTNVLGVQMDNVVIAYRDSVFQVNSIAPGETIDLAAIRSRTLPDYLGDRRFDQINDWEIRQGRVLRGEDFSGVMRTLLFASKTPENFRNYPSNYLRDLDFSDRLDIGKVVVVAQVAGPGGTLWLNQLPDPQKPEQQAPSINGVVKNQTYLRVLLDVSKDNQ